MTPASLSLLLKGLDLLVLGLNVAPEVMRAFKNITANVQLMVNQGRDPTPDEWRLIDNLRDEIHREIQRRK